jgi:hypothetical protein
MTAELPPQKRGRKIAMTSDELDEFLATERTCRVATVGPDGPHATPLWFGWDGTFLWLYSLTRSQRWADLMSDPRIGVVVDAGVEYSELRGAEITGTAEVVGETPRVGEPNPELVGAEALLAKKYFGGGQLSWDGRHGWLRVRPSKIASWDFRKLAPASG